MKILVLFLCLISNGVLAQKWVDPPPKYQCPLDDEIYPCKCLSDGDEGLVIECNNTNLAAAGKERNKNLNDLEFIVETLTICEF